MCPGPACSLLVKTAYSATVPTIIVWWHSWVSKTDRKQANKQLTSACQEPLSAALRHLHHQIRSYMTIFIGDQMTSWKLKLKAFINPGPLWGILGLSGVLWALLDCGPLELLSSFSPMQQPCLRLQLLKHNPVEGYKPKHVGQMKLFFELQVFLVLFVLFEVRNELTLALIWGITDEFKH